MKKKAIAFFDIDKTIIRVDSMIELIKYTSQRYPQTRKENFKFVLEVIKYKLGFITLKNVKEYAFKSLCYLTEEEIEQFYEKALYPKVYKAALNKIRELKKRGCLVILVTASPECYMKYFEKIDQVDLVIGTILKNENNKVINQIIGENCKGEEKVRRILEWLELNQIEIDKKNSYAFSDSLSDLPMLDLVDNKYLINSKQRIKNIEVLYWK